MGTKLAVYASKSNTLATLQFAFRAATVFISPVYGRGFRNIVHVQSAAMKLSRKI